MTTKLPYVQSRERPDGTFRYRGWAFLNGKRYYSALMDTPEEAYQAALAMRSKIAAGVKTCTLDKAIEMVLEETKTKRTDGSLRWYGDHFRAIVAKIPGTLYLTSITPQLLEQFIKDRLGDWARRPVLDEDGNVVREGRRVKPATVNADLRALHRVFAIAIRRGLATVNPVATVDRPRADAVAMDWFTSDELVAMLTRVQEEDEGAYDLFALLALTGIRRSEAGRLHASHVRWKTRQLVVPGKTGTRIVPLADDLELPLKRLLAAAGGGPLIVGGLRRIDEVFIDWKAKLKDRRLHPHALRHSFGTELIRQGTRPDVVMRLMGHRSLNTTLRYVHEVGADGHAATQKLQLLPRPPASRQKAGRRSRDSG